MLLIDVQTGVVRYAYNRQSVLTNIGILVERARRHGVPIIWVQHADDQLIRGSNACRTTPELTPDPPEHVIEKTDGDAFEETTLQYVLCTLGVEKLFVAGAETDACVRCLHCSLPGPIRSLVL